MTANPARSLSGRPNGRMTSSSDGAASATFSATVPPFTVSASPLSLPARSSSPMTAGTPPAR